MTQSVQNSYMVSWSGFDQWRCPWCKFLQNTESCTVKWAIYTGLVCDTCKLGLRIPTSFYSRLTVQMWKVYQHPPSSWDGSQLPHRPTRLELLMTT